MPWLELSINTTHEAIDWVRTLLASTSPAQPCEQPVYELQMADFDDAEPAPNEADSDETYPDKTQWDCRICIYLPRHQVNLLNKLVDLLSPLHRTGLTSAPETYEVETKPIALPSRQPRRIGQRFVILPPDSNYQPATAELPIYLADSFAFGSGLHPATFLTLRLLERYVTPALKALDLGCGSGILTVAMARLGAEVLALDNDELAVQATEMAIQQNQVEARVQQGSLGQGNQLGHWMSGDDRGDSANCENIPLDLSGKLDLIAANILARIHIALADDYRKALSPASQAKLLITSGYTADMESEVSAALQNAGFALVDTERYQEWLAQVYRYKL